MKNTMLAVVLSVVVFAPFSVAQEIAVDFEGKNPVQKVKSYKNLVETLAPEVKGSNIEPDRGWLGYDPAKVCKTIDLDSRDGASVVRYDRLTTLFRWRECESQYNCIVQSEWYDAQIELKIGARNLPQYETEKIEICFDFKAEKGSFRIVKSPFKYSYRDRNNGLSYSLELTPVRSVPQSGSFTVLNSQSPSASTQN